jgi:DNA mismatch repair protein MutL
LLEIEKEEVESGVHVKGFVSKPYDARNDKTQQALFVNGRWIRNEELTKTIYDAYHSLLFVGKHPIFIINIQLDPTKIDVNVHPTKSDIKIEQKTEVMETLFKAVREALQRHDLIPVMDFGYEQQLAFGKTLVREEQKVAAKYAFEPSEQMVLSFPSDELVPGESYSTASDVTNEIPASDKLPPLRLLGQIHKTFFVAETPGGVLFIDQHVVQERVLYEKFMEQFMNKRVAVQNLLQPEILELTPTQNLLLQENKDHLLSWGFGLEEFGDNSFLLRTVPTIFGRLQPKEMLFEIIQQLSEGKSRLEEVQEDIITRMACRASVKAGDTLTNGEMQILLGALNHTVFPYTCPHGRAVLIKMDVDELERKFHRK